MTEPEPLRYRAHQGRGYFASGYINLKVEESIDKYLSDNFIPHKVYPMAELGAGGAEIWFLIRLIKLFGSIFQNIYRSIGVRSLHSVKPQINIDLATSVSGLFGVENYDPQPGQLAAELIGITSGLHEVLQKEFSAYTLTYSIKVGYDDYEYYLALHMLGKMRVEDFGRAARFIHDAQIKGYIDEVYTYSNKHLIKGLKIFYKKKHEPVRSRLLWYFKFDKLPKGFHVFNGIGKKIIDEYPVLYPKKHKIKGVIRNLFWAESALKPGPYDESLWQETREDYYEYFESRRGKKGSSLY